MRYLIVYSPQTERERGGFQLSLFSPVGKSADPAGGATPGQPVTKAEQVPSKHFAQLQKSGHYGSPHLSVRCVSDIKLIKTDTSISTSIFAQRPKSDTQQSVNTVLNVHRNHKAY